MSKKKSVHQKKAGLPPGTLVFTGERYLDSPNVTLMQYSDDDLALGQMKDQKPPFKPGFKVTWYDVRGIHDLKLMERIGERFSIHPLILEDIVDTHQRPKFQEFEDGVFLSKMFPVLP